MTSLGAGVDIHPNTGAVARRPVPVADVELAFGPRPFDGQRDSRRPCLHQHSLPAGERVATLERLFDVRCGIQADDDLLPSAFTVPLADDPHAGSDIDVTEMSDEFCRRMGWSRNGAPTASTLERFELAAFASAGGEATGDTLSRSHAWIAGPPG